MKRAFSARPRRELTAVDHALWIRRIVLVAVLCGRIVDRKRCFRGARWGRGREDGAKEFIVPLRESSMSSGLDKLERVSLS